MNDGLRPAAIAAALLLAGVARAEPAKGPYEVKSGVYEATLPGGREVVYFDDFGRKRARYTTSTFGGAESHQLDLRLPEGTVYSVDLDDKTGTRMHLPPGAADARAVALPPPVERDTKARKLPARTYAGKRCQGLEAEARGQRTRTWRWKGIVLHAESGGAGSEALRVLIAVTRVSVGPVPPEKFFVPADVRIRDLDPQPEPSAR